ncbi:MAG: macrolide family glycosyltransferase, partial [Candidatus Limivicinus sp.]
MSKIVFFCIPAHGHTNPTLGVVRELVRRGHQVKYYSYEPFRTVIEAAGADFVPCNAYDAQLGLTPKDGERIGKDLAFSTHVLVETTLALNDMVCRDMAAWQPDCIVADSMAAWGKAVALKLGIPFVSSTTTFAFNQESAKIMKQSFRELLAFFAAMPKINKDVRRLQATGYPVKSVLDLIQNDQNTHTIVYTSPEFQPCAESFSDKYAFVGPSVRPAREQVTKTHEKLVYVSMGTVVNDRLALYRNCIAALAGEDLQLILSVGEQVDIAALGPLPENVSVYPKVDQIAVLEKADAFLSHCGMNSASESLYYGVPLLCFPQTKEQGGVAARVTALGAGIMLENPSVSCIKAAVKLLLSDTKIKANAEEIARSFHRCTGPVAAADKIEQVI